MKNIEIYTDGACQGNPGPGGYGAIIIYNGVEKKISGFEEDTTNNRMELLAPIVAMECLNEICEINLYSDSAYLVNGFDKGWIYSWMKNNWKTAQGSAVKNVDLWKRLYELSKMHKITWIKVKGHADNKYNNLCDKLAVDAIKNRGITQESEQAKCDKKESSNASMVYTAPTLDIDDFEEVTLSKEMKYVGRIFNVEKHVVELPDGSEAFRDIVTHKGAAAVVPIDEDGYVYMVRQYRKAHEAICLEIPAGKLDENELPEKCAVRELEEEIGLVAGRLEELFVLWPSPAILTEKIYVYAAFDLVEGQQNLDDGEFLDIDKIHLSTLRDMIVRGEVNDSKTISAIMVVCARYPKFLTRE